MSNISKASIKQKKLISFVLPIFEECENIDLLWQELQKISDTIKKKYDCEFVFVNDGSRDISLEKLVEIHYQNPKTVKVVDFSRNFGHQIAVTAGQDYATGNAVIIMDTDLQDPPETCLDLIKEWENGFDIVYAQRSQYESNPLKKWSAYVFYRTLKKIASVDIPVDTGDFRLISKRVNDEMKKYKEKAKYLRGISSMIGFSQTAVPFRRSDRHSGKTGYTFLKSLRLALDGITGFSIFPLQMISIVGMIFSIFSFVVGMFYIIFSMSRGDVVEGWTSIMFVSIFIGGVQMMMLGIIGEYVGRIYIQSLDRPLYTIDKTWGVKSKVR